jgi:YegS/Rv2252/BmrU family lipid kinase
MGSPYPVVALDANRRIGRVPHAPLVLVNPVAGGGRASRLVPILEARIAAWQGARVVVTRHAGEAEQLAAAAATDGHDRVVAVGGDGTVQEVVNGLLSPAGADAPELGILPVGTGNDLARSLGLPREVEEAMTVALGEGTTRIDVARARNGHGEERRFASAGGIGFDAQVAAAMSARRGWQATRAGYLLTTLAELRRFENRHVQITIDEAAIEADVLFVAIANGEYYGGGMRIAPGAEPSDGRLDVCVVGDITRLTALRQLPNLYRGTHVSHPAVTLHAGSRIAVEGDAATRIHLDGEPFGALPLIVTLEAGALAVAAR